MDEGGRLPERPGALFEVEIQALAGDPLRPLVEDHVALGLNRHRLAIERQPFGVDDDVAIVDLHRAAGPNLALAEALELGRRPGDRAATAFRWHLELERDAVGRAPAGAGGVAAGAAAGAETGGGGCAGAPVAPATPTTSRTSRARRANKAGAARAARGARGIRPRRQGIKGAVRPPRQSLRRRRCRCRRSLA